MTVDNVGEHIHVQGDPPCNGCGWQAPGVVLVHSGVYSLFTTPAGGRHLVYRPDGGPEDVQVPDIPAAALPLVENFLTYGLPPQIVALLGQLVGKDRPGVVQLASLFRSLSGQLTAAAANGNGDGPDGDT